mmetsp:Transcript_32330/g.52228  ORF Transcript_32330/g.52228 Transcript_32330/m.52228 type:complete len:399 (+) Transcript_32330:152-1348(+)|eukprot:CAMPEP_0184658010 /NCGR_PEP_ID=MMETSP0308-20130426/23304_1 /TAXON_ID=38269 /ORGANISM="Gloeochaete witrockiana, Strain SAG 46.84" /LENGTH=398 /DNA_ID=CAMNT_0027096583 /DNA_START=82 /DNA_END=1278 /DNA_ORIENTATION=+
MATLKQSTSSVPRIAFDDLQMLNQIGSGTFGEVFKAQFIGKELVHNGEVILKPNTTVAVKKLFKGHLDPIVYEEFMKEVDIMKHLKHRGVVKLLGLCENPLLMVCEFMSRGSLNHIINDPEASLTLDNIVNFGIEMAEAMDYLHSVNIIHRDLKSHNILVDEDWHCKISDFGLSRVKAEKSTMTQCGTSCWMAPEVLCADRYTLAADVYSFGIVLWELLTRLRPYGTLNAMEIGKRVVLERMRPDIPASSPSLTYTAVMKSCWDHDPTRRPQFTTAIAMLRSILADPEVDKQITIFAPMVLNRDRTSLRNTGNLQKAGEKRVKCKLSDAVTGEGKHLRLLTAEATISDLIADVTNAHLYPHKVLSVKNAQNADLSLHDKIGTFATSKGDAIFKLVFIR